jgi:hypothetical protein
MATRPSSRIVSFTRPFRLSAMTHQLAAGSYTVETDEERLESASVPAYGRRGTFIRIPLPSGAAGAPFRIMIDPVELEAALTRDAAPEEYGPETLTAHAAREGSRL